MKAPLHTVVKVMEMTGPRGGTIHVLVLECGAFMTRRLKDMCAAPERVPCVACFVKANIGADGWVVVHQRVVGSSLVLGDDDKMLTTCGEVMRNDTGGWVWRREHVTCPRCLAVPATPLKRRRKT